MFNIYQFANKFGLLRDGFKAMEIGVGPLVKSRLLSLIEKGYECHLVEGLPKYHRALQEAFGSMSNVTISPCVVSDTNGEESIFDRGEGSWITSLPSSPDTQNNNVVVNPKHCQTVKSVTLDRIDTGDIDIMLIDTEGAEWLALKHMVSRPEIIVIETHLVFHKYRNPYAEQINRWMDKNGYDILAIEVADTMYCKR